MDEKVQEALKLLADALSGDELYPLMMAHGPGRVIIAIGDRPFLMEPNMARQIGNQLIVSAAEAESEMGSRVCDCPVCKANAAERGAGAN